MDLGHGHLRYKQGDDLLSGDHYSGVGRCSYFIGRHNLACLMHDSLA